ncbi:MAG: hypothetical protein EBX40_07880 [Gammaproteobacteria bacterium]|nr:hypothetical protein [Gammaproteobacteria bacterium]
MGHKIKVRIVEHLEADNTELYGCWSYDTKTIFLSKNCDWPSVLLHEMTHAIASLSGWNEGLTQSKEESIVVAIEHALAPLIR